ncbi:MAG: serine hydrolase [Bacteroidota bacterium]
MSRYLLVLLLFCSVCFLSAQPSYFPPTNSEAWELTDPEEVGWCQENIDSLYTYLENQNTKAFLILKDGKIVLEKYFGTFEQDSVWYWASAGKSLKAFLIGLAQEQGLLSITDKTSAYLGEGWTQTSPEQEAQITIQNQLSMNTGLDDGVSDPFCTEPACLQYKTDAGDRWAYHNGPYTLLSNVLESATGLTENQYTFRQLNGKTGMVGMWIPSGYNRIFFSTARNMARFGLLVQNQGVWDGDTLLSDQEYFRDMISPSQELNPAYGYLWWLNGQRTYKLPGLQFDFGGEISPNAPSDMYAAMGKNGQILNIIPSENLIVVRMGNNPNNSLVPTTFQNEMWERINELSCSNATNNDPALQNTISLYPNPAEHTVNVTVPFPTLPFHIQLRDAVGRTMWTASNQVNIDLQPFPAGIYYLTLSQAGRKSVLKLIKA